MSVKVPPDMNLVRVTGLGVGYPVPKGFESEWVRLDGDHQKYLPRKGYRIAPCPNVGTHGFNAGCPTCEPYHGAIAVPVATPAATLKSLGRFRRFNRNTESVVVFDTPQNRAAGVTPGTYDWVGSWVLRADGGSVALQHRPLSSGALRSPGALGAKPRCVKCDGSGKLTMRGVGWEPGWWNQRRRVTATVCCFDCDGTGEAGSK